MPSEHSVRLFATQIRPLPHPGPTVTKTWTGSLGHSVFKTDFFENDWSMLVLLNSAEILPEAGGFFLGETPNIRSLKVRWRSGQETILSPDQFTVSSQTGPWEETYDWNLSRMIKARNTVISIRIPEPSWHSLELKLTYTEKKDEGGAISTPVSLGDPKSEFRFNKNLFPFPEPWENSDSQITVRSIVNHTESLDIKVPQRTDQGSLVSRYRGLDITGNRQMTVTIRSEYQTTPMQKTTFLNITSISTEGLGPENLTIRDPGAFVYAPGHHNFSYEYAVDLTMAADISEISRAWLKTHHIRYLVIRGQSWPALTGTGNARVFLFSSDGDKKDKGPFTWSFTREPVE